MKIEELEEKIEELEEKIEKLEEEIEESNSAYTNIVQELNESIENTEKMEQGLTSNIQEYLHDTFLDDLYFNWDSVIIWEYKYKKIYICIK